MPSGKPSTGAHDPCPARNPRCSPDRLASLNPEWQKYSDQVEQGRLEERLNPDGDVELGPGVRYEDFNVPPCDTCGGDMKPVRAFPPTSTTLQFLPASFDCTCLQKVTFFGESLSPEVRDESMRLVKSASRLLVVGSSLATFSAFRLVRQKKEEGGPVGLLNVGESRGDPVVDWRVGWAGGAGDILPAAVKILAQDEKRKDVRDEVEEMLKAGKVKRITGTRATT